MKKFLLLIIFCFALGGLSAQSGGTFDLSQSVIAGGGSSNKTGGTLNTSGTSGQHSAGTVSSGDAFILSAGFWTQGLTPTSAPVSITGRVTTPSGQGINRVRLKLTFPDGSVRSATTSSFGYYAFDGVPVGNTYVLEVSARRFMFTAPARVFSIQDHITGMDFVAEP